MGQKGQTSTTTSKLPPWLDQGWQDLSTEAHNTAWNDINKINYKNLDSQFQNSTNNILDQQVNPQQLASGITQAGQASWTDPGTAQSYMNPYESTALQSQIGIDRNSLLNPELAQVDQGAAAAGALGGDRSQVMKANLVNNFNNTEANTVAQGMNSAYQTGQGAFTSDANRNLSGQTQGANTQLAGANSNVYANFAAGQNGLNRIAASEAPLQQLGQYGSILSGAQQKQGTQQTVQTPNGGGLGSILGGVLGGVAQLLPTSAMAKGGSVDEALKKKSPVKTVRKGISSK